MHGMLSSGRKSERKKNEQCVRSSYCLGLFWTILENGLAWFGSNFATLSLTGLRKWTALDKPDVSGCCLMFVRPY